MEARFFIQVFREQVGIHLGGKEGHAGLLFGEGVNVLGSLGIELEGGKNQDGRLGTEGAGLIPGELDLVGVQRAVLGAEGDDHALGLDALGFGVGMQPAGAGQGLGAGEINMMAALAAQAGLEQLVAPLGMAESGAGAGDGVVGGRRRRGDFIEGADGGSGNGFYREGAGNADFAVISTRFVIEGFRNWRLIVSDGF